MYFSLYTPKDHQFVIKLREKISIFVRSIRKKNYKNEEILKETDEKKKKAEEMQQMRLFDTVLETTERNKIENKDVILRLLVFNSGIVSISLFPERMKYRQ